ncbi:hypothetical protein [Methylosinus sp. Ce-a6]|uniref:hypothetical protein n=1 Tax=Methylosinus sp. Ce-a6 TaxID=2172005 RepID=UPI00135C160B|nr:hypothetical protein [Methylosinus sp. Ce-a6]
MTDIVAFFGIAVRAADRNGNPIFVNGQQLLIPEAFGLQSQINAAHYQSTFKDSGLSWFSLHYAQGASGDPQRQGGYSGGFDPRFTDAGNYACLSTGSERRHFRRGE